MLKKTQSIIFAVFITVFYGLYSRLWRVRHLQLPEFAKKKEKPVVYAHWHGDELFLIGAHIGSGLAAMTSRSVDGQMLTYVLKWFGFRTVRGSSTRGGAGGLKGLIDVVKKERRSASVAVDGPRGPIFKVKPGIIKLAQETGSPIIGGGAAVEHRHIFEKAWNRCYLPYPFSRGVVVYTEPVYVPKDISDSEFEMYRVKVETLLLKAKADAEAEFHRNFLPEMRPLPA